LVSLYLHSKQLTERERALLPRSVQQVNIIGVTFTENSEKMSQGRVLTKLKGKIKTSAKEIDPFHSESISDGLKRLGRSSGWIEVVMIK
jgi:hypothetical protein